MRAVLPLLLPAALLFSACEDGPYGAPYGDFYCGPQTCEITTQYCLLPAADAGGSADATCVPIPLACAGVPACSCVSTPRCASTCQAGSDGSVTLTCTD